MDDVRRVYTQVEVEARRSKRNIKCMTGEINNTLNLARDRVSVILWKVERTCLRQRFPPHR
jgi:hypothetical protein